MTLLDRRPTRATRAKYATGKRPSIESRLLPAMERLLARGQRLSSVSVEQLMEEAGMARASFYKHFKDRGELVVRLVQVLEQEFAASTGTWLSDAQNAYPKDMEAALSGMVDVFNKHHAIVTAIEDLAPHDAAVSKAWESLMISLSQRARNSLATVKKKGRSRPGATDDVADAMWWMVALYCAKVAGGKSGAELKRLKKTLGYICSSVAFADGIAKGK